MSVVNKDQAVLFEPLLLSLTAHWTSRYSKLDSTGFTLIELMLGLAIIGILAAVIDANLTTQIRRSQEAVTKVNLGTLRSGLAIYYADSEGQYPTSNVVATMSGPYWPTVPIRYVYPWHPAGNDVDEGGWSAMVAARAAWFYVDDSTSPDWGRIVVNCVHQDIKNVTWSSY